MGVLHVAAAVVVNVSGEVLVALRSEDKHQGGLWEFPGGKLECGENVRAALQRELSEELGIEVEQARPLIRVHHDYPDRSVLLDVWRVEKFSGTAHGCEGQEIKWLMPEDLSSLSFPEANMPIVKAAQLPESYLITPEPELSDEFLDHLERVLKQGVQMVQLRSKKLEEAAYKELAKAVVARCHANGARLLLNASPEWVAEVGADGVHFASGQLLTQVERPLADNYLVAASCHTLEELQHAEMIKADFALLSPVKATKSHPGEPPLGWGEFQKMTDAMAMPVYALGGMTPADLSDAFKYGAQGIAAIGALWALGK